MTHPVMPPVIFLDVDGVLNSHDALIAGEYVCGIHRDKIARLNRLVKITGAEVVISSAWRYMILGGAMTVDGFRYMLVTHGLSSAVKIIGYTKSDEVIPERGDQISEYIERNGIASYVVLDDGCEVARDDERPMSATLAVHSHRWIKIDGAVGFQDSDVERAALVLNGGAACT